MRSRSIFIAVTVFIVIGIAASLVYFKNHSGSTPQEPTAVASSGIPSPDASGIVPSPSGSPNPSGTPNPSPDLTLDANGLSKATVVVTTTRGVIKFKFYPKDAPATVKRMIDLINQGFYNGLTFHRVIPGFVVQGGDPQGNGTGGSGQHLKAEFNERRHVEGTVAMARAADPDSADSQFYITLSPQPHLDHSYTIFGQVIEGLDVVRQLQIGDKMTSVVIQ